MRETTAMTGLAFYVSPEGDDGWSGRQADPSEGRSDGPFATLMGAREALRALKRSGELLEGATVWLRGGRYHLSEPVIFTPDDSGPVTYAAYPGEQPILDGGRRISGWRIEGSGASARWIVDLPEVAAGQWYFRQLFVGGERRERPHLPQAKGEHYRITGVPGQELDRMSGDPDHLFEGSDTFTVHPGDVQASWRNLTDVEVVVLHYWIEERMPIARVDEATNTVMSSRRSTFVLRDDVARRYAPYYVENVAEALGEPGQWYLDRQTGRLTYLPVPGEDPATAEVYAPIAEQLLRLDGDPDNGALVENLRFVGLRFAHTAWSQPTGRPALFDETGIPDQINYASAPQAACNIGAAISMTAARQCAIEDSHLAHIGGYGIELADGCHEIRIVGNDLSDLGAGGVKVGGAAATGSRSRQTGDNHITDNHIHAGGRVFPSAVGILMTHTYGNSVAHNHIHDLYYSGISCGWVWGYAENVSRDNHIIHNHIHDLGHGLLSDMGGIYTLGVQPGTVIRGNLIHDVVKRHYGGWGIYLDEGSSHMLVEQNLCYHTSSQGFHEHYGRENIIRNNIFAFGGEGQLALSRAEAHNSLTCEQNILISSGQPFFVGGYRGQLEKRGFRSDLNLLWDTTGPAEVMVVGANGRSDEHGDWMVQQPFALQEWHQLGYDHHSTVANPLCRDLQRHDFTLNDGSPAFALGFQQIDLSTVGPRRPEARHDEQ